MKYLLLLALIVVVGLVLRHRHRASRSGGADPRQPDKPAEDMVPCAHCGVYLSRNESVADGERLYCSEAHRRAGSR